MDAGSDDTLDRRDSEEDGGDGELKPQFNRALSLPFLCLHMFVQLSEPSLPSVY